MDLRIGEDSTLLHPSSATAALAALIRAGGRRLWLRVPQLDPLSNDGDVLDALKSLALSSPRADLRVLFDDAGHAVKTGHGLIHLGRRLPSRLQLRQTQADDADPRLGVAVAPRAGPVAAHGPPRPAPLARCAHARPPRPRRARGLAHHRQPAPGAGAPGRVVVG